MNSVLIDGESLTTKDVIAVSRNNDPVEIAQKAREKVKKSRRALEEFIKKEKVVYGVTTGFGAFGSVVIPSERIKELQYNLIRSHSAGVGKPLDRDVTRALMLLRANTLAKGNSGIKLVTLETLVQMINKGVHPLIPEKGSVSASGDLAPLSHMTLVMMGEGEAEFEGKVMNGQQAMSKAGITPIKLDFKEGLALNNGTQMVTAIGVLAIHDTERLIKTAEIAASLSLEALSGISDAFDEKIHNVRPHPGQIKTARNIRLLTSGSQIIRSSSDVIKEIRRSKTRHPQDPYSLRCIPQVLGAARDAASYARRIIETEINSATDNPLIFAEDGECLSGGNFHGQPISVVMDLLGIALTTVGNMSERRIARLIDENLSQGLPPFLIHSEVEKGIHSGFMSVQYTAAALASENKTMAHPASVDSIPTSANFEDFVSMGSIAARKATRILVNSEYILAIELLCAAQAVEFRGSEKLGQGTRVAYSLIREKVPMLRKDRVMSKDIEDVGKLIRNGRFVEAVERASIHRQS
ncbi:MAG: histidine ammonia-lyase [Candidatus Bathyarchaeota archaeon]|nr:MAG: histidine ammonia-lyase [Candidatus Bathyarchaeota archaeon]